MSTSTARRSKKAAQEAPPTTNCLGELRDEAAMLEAQLEAELWRDAIRAARAAVESLQENESSGHHYDRRRGLRLREKAMKVDAAFNPLRALRRGDLLPLRAEDEF